MAQKRKLRIVNKTKLITSAVMLILVPVLLITLISSLSGDKIEKAIKKLEDTNITVLDRRFETSVKNETVVDLGDTVVFKLVYYYQTDDKAIRSYSVTEDITLTISGHTEDNPSKAAYVDGNSLSVLTTATAGETIKVTASHKYAEDKVFEFTVSDTEYIE